MSVFAHPKLRSFLEGRTFTKDFAWRHVKSRELRAERAEPSVPAENTSSATRGSRDEMWFDGFLVASSGLLFQFLSANNSMSCAFFP